jgi:hypothetical protein
MKVNRKVYVIVYDLLREVALNFANKHQTENPGGFSEVGHNN